MRAKKRVFAVCLVIKLRSAVCEERKAIIFVFAKINFLIEDRPTKVSLILVGGVAEANPALVSGAAEVSPALVDGAAETSRTFVGGAAEINRFFVIGFCEVYRIEEGASREIVFKI